MHKLLLSILFLTIHSIRTADTPLHVAARMGSHESAQVLLKHGANPFIKNRKGERPLEVASTDEMFLIIYRGEQAFLRSWDIQFINCVFYAAQKERAEQGKHELINPKIWNLVFQFYHEHW